MMAKQLSVHYIHLLLPSIGMRSSIHAASQPASKHLWKTCLCWFHSGTNNTMIDQTETLFSKKLVQLHGFRASFLSLHTVNIMSWIILCGEGCCVNYKMYSSVPGLYPLDSSSTCPSSHDY